MEKTPLNPWLAGLIMDYRAARPEGELRAEYDRYRESRPDATWKGFLIDMSFLAAAEKDPFLGTDIAETGLPAHAVDILRCNYIDSVGMLMQLSLEELSRMKGLSPDEFRAVVNLLGEHGLRLEETGRTLKEQFSRHMAARKPAEDILTLAREKIDAIHQQGDGSMSDFGMWAHRISDVHLETVRQLREVGADKETLRRAYRAQVGHLIGEVTENKDLAGTAVEAAGRLVSLTEYLYGAESRDAVEARKMRADTFFMAEKYQDALGLYGELIAFLEERPHLAPEVFADACHCAGICLMPLDRNEESVALLLKALPFFEQDPVKYRKTLWELYSTISEVYSRIGDDERMVEFSAKSDKYSDNPIHFMNP